MSSVTTGPSLRQLRLTAQRIDKSELVAPVDAVRWMLAMQGQDLAGAKWSLGVRVPGSTLSDVDAALGRGEIIRSWPMRGTLHLVAAPDIGWMLELTAARTLQSLTRRHRELGLDEQTYRRAGDIATALLEGGRAATRAEIFGALTAAGIDTSGQRGPHLLGGLHQSRLLCLGPMRGNEQAVVLLDEWVPHLRTLDRDEALGEFVFRYFTSHGPATLRDFAWWTKLPLRDGKVGLAIARGQLDELVIDDVSYWLAPGLTDRSPVEMTPHSSVYALPGFDELLLGYQDRSASLAAEHMQAIVPGGNGMFLSTIVVDGRVVGTWRRKKTSAGITLTPIPFAPMTARTRIGLAAAAARYGNFMETTVTVGDSA